MRKSAPIRPLYKEPPSELVTGLSALQEEPTNPTREGEPRPQPRPRKQSQGSGKARSILSRLVASRQNSNAGVGRRVESDAVTAVLENSFDPTVQAAQHRVSLAERKGTETHSPVGETEIKLSRERKGRRCSTHTRMSSVDSIEPLASKMVQKVQDWHAEVTFDSDINTDRRDPHSQLSAQSSSRLLCPSPHSVYNIKQVASSSQARKELLALNPALHIVSMATSTPEEYPLLDLSGLGLEDADVWKVVRLVEVYPFATDLDLYGNTLTIGRNTVVPAGVEQREIKRLSLRRCPLGKGGEGSRLGAFLSIFVGMERLDLRECGLGDQDLGRIGADLIHFPRLQVLLLSNNLITNLSAPVLLSILERLPALTQIDLRQTNTSRSLRKALGKHRAKVVLTEGRKCCGDCHLF